MSLPPSLVTVDASEPIEKINEIIARDGGVIVANFLPQQLINKSTKDVDRLFALREQFEMNETTKLEMGTNFFPKGTQRVYGLIGKMTDLITEAVRHGVWQGIMDHFLSGESFSLTGDTLVPTKSGYMVASTAALRLAPGAQPQPLHRDHIKFHPRPDPNNPLFTPMFGCLIAGTKCTFRNGATAVIPGSHLWAPDRVPKIGECTYAEMEPRSALFTHGATYHAAGENICEPNDPDAVRPLFACFGQCDYYRADQDETFSTPLEVVRKIPDDVLRLAGYYKSVGGGGYVGDHQHPIDLINSQEASGKVVSNGAQSAT